MGLFGRRRRDGAAAQPVAVPVAESAGAVSAPADGGWAATVPLQRVLGVPRLTADRNFPASLATRQNPAFSGGIGHTVAASAPSGLLLDALTPVPTPLPPSPTLQRLPLATPAPLAPPPPSSPSAPDTLPLPTSAPA
ncbi:hypothetical protein ABZ670_14350, partial [Streptomyces subrutilus]